MSHGRTVDDLTEEEKERAKLLGVRLKELLEIAFNMDARHNKAEMATALSVRKELEEMGFTITWSANMPMGYHGDYRIEIDIVLWLPKMVQ